MLRFLSDLHPVAVTLALAVAMAMIELVRPGRTFPRVRGWLPRAIAVNLVQGGVVFALGHSMDRWLSRVRPWSADELGVAGGAAVGYLVITFVYYWWHRWRHEVPFLWRWFHQFHHSPSRIEIVTSFFKHPFEVVANGLLSSAILYLGVGLSPAAATIAVTATGVAELFYHWNVRTPYWLGFVFQRPESHCIHHERGRHTGNFADLPLWDMLFGTFENPRSWRGRCGIGDAAETRLVWLLRGRLVEGDRT